MVIAKRFDEWVSMSSTELVPGDLIKLSARRSVVPADVILLEGEVVADESMLTGESVPCSKVPFKR